MDTATSPQASTVGEKPAEHSKLLAAFAASQNLEVPDAVLTLIEECVLDLVGQSAYSARFVESSQAFRDGTRRLDPNGSGFTVIGEANSYSQVQAALLNGSFAHSMDFDDTNTFGILHPGAPIIPAAMAAAEGGDATGREFLDAIAVGYEVASRIGGALGLAAYDRGFHNTSVAGIFGAVAAAARLRRLGAAVVETAFGIAGSLASGSMQYLENGSWNKRLHAGFAAHAALMALGFAEAGVIGAIAPVEGRFGLLNSYSPKPRPELLTDKLGMDWVALQTGIKPYPSCRMTHSAVDAALTLRERFDASARADAKLRVALSQKSFDLVGEALPGKIAPRNIVDAQFSVYFQVANAWLDGQMTWQSYDRIGERRLEDFSSRMQVEVDVSLPTTAARLSVQGVPESTELVLVPSGEPSTPLGRTRMRQKYSSLAEPVFGNARAGEIADRLLYLRRESRVTAVIAMLRQPA